MFVFGQIISGANHLFAITTNSNVFSWGYNYNGELGLGYNNEQKKPQLVEFFKDKSVKKIICGSNYSFAITSDGDVFSWGNNIYGELGLGHNNNSQNKPQLVDFFKDKSVKNIFCNGYHSFAITSDGYLFSWGNNNYGELGLGHYNDENKPQLVDFFKDKSVKNIFCGYFHSFAIDNDGYLFSWGKNNQGELGLGHYYNDQNKPQLVEFFKDKSVKKIFCGGFHTFAITNDGFVFSWGRNYNGQLGLGHYNDQNKPQLVDFFKNNSVKNIICGSNHSFAITTDDFIFSWGNNNDGQLGLGHNNNENKPQLVKFFQDKIVKNIICGCDHSFAITSDGNVFSWGYNYFGQCGYGYTVDYSVGTGQHGSSYNNSQNKPQLVDFFCSQKMVESKNSDFLQTNNKTSLKVHLNKIYENCITIEI